MNFLKMMQNRYTTKKYDKTKKLSAEQLAELKEILHLTPSSINGQAWKFSFVENEEIKKKLAEVSIFNKHKIEDASILVVFSIIDDLEIFEEQANENLAEGTFAYYKDFLKPLGEEHIKNRFARQVYIALGVFLSACGEMGIDSTAMEGIEPRKYDEILGQTGKYTTLFSVAIGKRAEDDENQPNITPKKRVDFDKIIETI